MFIRLLIFELTYHFKQLTFKIALLIFFFLGMVAVTGGFGGEEVHRNGPFVIATILSLFSVFSIFVSTLFCANVVLRDSIYQMDELIFSTKINKLTYLLVRFLGLFISALAALSISLLGIFIFTIFDAGPRIGEFKLIYFLQPWFIFALPNVLFSSGLIFATAILTKNLRAIYAMGVLLYVFYMLASIFGNSPLLAQSELKVSDPSILPDLLDPFGLATLFGDTKFWTATERNHQIFPLSKVFLVNRTLWIAFTAGVLTVGFKFFNFRLLKKTSGKKVREIETTNISYYYTVKTDPKNVNYGLQSVWSQFKIEAKSVFQHIPFMVLLLLWTLLFGIELNDSLFNGAYGIQYFPTTGMIIEQIRWTPLSLILLIFYTAELLSREKTVNFQAMIYSTSVNNWAMWMAKYLTLVLLIVCLITLNILIGVELQIGHGYFNFEWTVYLSLYYYGGFPLLLFALLFVFVQSLTPNKFVGMLLNMMIAFLIVFSKYLGINHFMVRYAMSPTFEYSNFDGFGNYAHAFNWYIAYWLGFTGLLSIIAIACWQNGRSRGWLQHQIGIYSMIKRKKFLFILSLSVLIFSGSYIYFQTNVEGEYKSKEDQLTWRANYEKEFKRFEGLPQPTIKSVNTVVKLYPKLSSYTVHGTYWLKNETKSSITEIWAGVDSEVSAFSVAIIGATYRKDLRFKHCWIKLKRPLQPGENIKFTFSIAVKRTGFVSFNSENSVSLNGSYIELEKFVPHFGYETGLEIDDEDVRAKVGLKKRVGSLHPDLEYHLIDFETIVSTDADQQVVTVGDLKENWKKNGRRFFHYKTTNPINFMFALSSAKYIVQNENHEGIPLKLMHRDHSEYNVKTIMQAIKDALDYGNENFGSYPFRQFTLAEIPHYKGAATAYPGVVFSAERINFLSDFSNTRTVDQAYAITVHEVAHQWWANKLAPVYGKGSALLTESLAKYTELMVMEKKFGKMYLRNYLKYDHQLYFGMRDSEKEEPLAMADDQPYVYYQKGGLTLFAMKEMLGERKMNFVLRTLIKKFSFPNQKITPSNFLSELKAQASIAQQRQIDESFNQVVTYQASIKKIAATSLANGKHRSKVLIRFEKSNKGIKQKTLSEVYLTMGMTVQEKKSAKQTIYKQYKIAHNTILLNLIVEGEISSLELDPFYHLLINDRNNCQIEF